MAARFPQSATPISGKRIPPALVTAGVKAVIWAATADSVHVLLAGQTTTTLLTRTPGGATYNSTDGRISGTVTGNGTSQYFALAVVGGIGVVANDYTQIVSYFGDTGTWWPNMWFIGSDSPMGGFGDWDGLYGSTFARINTKRGLYQQPISTSGSFDYGNGSDDFCVFATRVNQGDATAKHRAWCNGSEDTSARNNTAISDTTAIGSSTGRAIYFGGTNANTAGGVGIAEFEAALIGTGAIDATTMDALTAKTGPTTWIEDAPAGGLSGTATLDDEAASGTLSGGTASDISGTATLGDVSASGSISTTQGTITSPPLSRNNGTLAPAGGTLTWLGFRLASTGAPVLLKTGVVLDGASRFSVSDPALVGGGLTQYTMEWLESTGERGRGEAYAT